MSAFTKKNQIDSAGLINQIWTFSGSFNLTNLKKMYLKAKNVIDGIIFAYKKKEKCTFSGGF